MTIVPFLARVNTYILNPLIVFVFSLAVVYFVYGIVKYISAGTEVADKTREEARNAVIWGIVGIVVMVSVFGLIRFVLATFGVNRTTTINGVQVENTKYLDQASPR